MKILGIRVDNLDMVQALCRVHEFMGANTPGQIITLNAEILYNARRLPEFKEIIEKADLVTPDGSGIVWAAKKLGEPLKERVTGIDLMTEICRQAAPNSWPVYLLGGRPGIAQAAAENLEKLFPGIEIAGFRDGYFNPEEESSVVEEINASGAKILFAALGAPKQEFWLNSQKNTLNAKVLMGVGGSLDVLSGQVKRAPLIFQKLGIEWLWRLLLQPWRIKRALVLPKFMLAVIKSRHQRKLNQPRQENKRRQLP